MGWESGHLNKPYRSAAGRPPRRPHGHQQNEKRDQDLPLVARFRPGNRAQTKAVRGMSSSTEYPTSGTPSALEVV